MAVIEKIRQRSGLVIVVIGVALASFLLSDALSNKGFNSQDTTVGVIDGEKVEYADFQNRVERLTKALEERGQQVDDVTAGMIRDQIWNEYFQERVIDKEYDELGITVTPDELYNTITNPVDFPQIRDAQAFQNPTTGQFDRSIFENAYNTWRTGTDEANVMQWKQWVEFEQQNIIPQLIQKKYNALVSKGIYRTAVEIEDEFFGNFVNFEAKVVGFNFNSVADSSVDVTVEEMEAYLKAHPEDYKQEASRKIEYVVFDVLPSSKDTAEVIKWANKAAVDFEKTNNDTLFVEINGDGNFFDTSFKSRGTFPESVDAAIFSAEAGSVVGPHYENGTYSVYKVLGFNEDTVPYIKASQILVKPRGINKEDSLAAVSRASAIMAAAKAGNFEDIARDSSQDFRTRSQGGDLGWMKKGGGSLPEVVERTLYASSEGSIFMVRSSLGVHIVKVTGGKTTKTANVQTVSRRVEYSGESDGEVYNQAYDFASKSRTADEYSSNAEAKGLIKRISPDLKEGETSLPSLDGAREVIRWAYADERAIGDVSEVFNTNDKYIVAHLVSIKEKGTAKLDDVRDQVENDTRLEKKTAMLKERIKKAMEGKETIEQIALELGAIVNNAPNTQFANTNLPFIGNDPSLVGAICGSEEGKFSTPIRSDNGVYTFVVVSKNANPYPTELGGERMRLAQTDAEQASGRAFQALQKAADVEDFRYKFF
ncbi:MAG: hypothetical protein EP332_15190 [Bacteroidetes bacterium]|nr:MAG: hypothetical protein EP332_15190 [Bacteroidota bacterium]